VIVEALLLWFLTWVGLLAIVGFLLLVTRGALGRHWSDRGLLRASLASAFIGSLTFWILLLLLSP
jgi:hypothetical protein